MCESASRLAPARRFPGGRFGLVAPAPRPLAIPTPRPAHPPKLIPDFDGEPGDDWSAAP